MGHTTRNTFSDNTNRKNVEFQLGVPLCDNELNEAQFIGNTTSTWSTGGIRFGFNLSRVFTIVDPSRFKK